MENAAAKNAIYFKAFELLARTWSGLVRAFGHLARRGAATRIQNPGGPKTGMAQDQSLFPSGDIVTRLAISDLGHHWR